MALLFKNTNPAASSEFAFSLLCLIFHALSAPVMFICGMTVPLAYNVIMIFFILMLILFREEIPFFIPPSLCAVDMAAYDVLMVFFMKLDCGSDFLVFGLIASLIFFMTTFSAGKRYFEALSAVCAVTATASAAYCCTPLVRQNTLMQLGDLTGIEGFVSENSIIIHALFCASVMVFQTMVAGFCLLDEIKKSSDAARAKVRELEFISNHDPLTRLLNRRKSLEYTRRLEGRKEREGEDWAVCIFDIDNFKRINDVYGHDCGDIVLKSVADLISKALEERPEIQFSRWGGEEFLITFPFAGSEPQLLLDGLRRKVMQERFEFRSTRESGGSGTESVGISATFGLATSLDEASGEKMLNLADKFLHEGKIRGKNQVVSRKEYEAAANE